MTSSSPKPHQTLQIAEVWTPFLSDEEREVIRRGRYGYRQPAGVRPALLLVDLQRSVVGLDKPILEQQGEWPSGVGEAAWKAVGRLADLLAVVRVSNDSLVIHTRLVRAPSSSDVDMYAHRVDRGEAMSVAASEIVPPLSATASEVVVDKRFPSAFFGTPLASTLVRNRVDTLVIGGGSTSGCVQATAVDGASRGYTVIVLADGTFDRIQACHATALLNIWMKTGDVISCDDAKAIFRGAASNPA